MGPPCEALRVAVGYVRDLRTRLIPLSIALPHTAQCCSPRGTRLLTRTNSFRCVNLFCAIFFFSSTAMRESSVPPAVARSILVTVCSAYGGDVTSYGAARVTDARQYSQARELAVAGRQYGLAVPTHRRRVRLSDTLWASAADSAVPKTGRPWTSTTTANS